jgi:hypothetical protein
VHLEITRIEDSVRRGCAIEEVAAASRDAGADQGIIVDNGGSIMTEPELVAIRTFGNRINAELAHSALRAADIHSTILDDDAGGTQPELWLRGVTLMVRAEDAERAEEILGAADNR